MDEKVVSVRESDGHIVTIEVHKTLHSTSRVARKYAEDGQADRYAVLAEQIKNSDGSTDSGVFMSLILRPSFFPSQASLLGAMSVSAAVTALEEHTSKRIGIGWVSDIYCEGTRIGNTSIEGKLNDYMGYEYLIVNFSVRLDKENFPPRLTDLIVEVFESGKETMPLLIAQNILAKFFGFYANIKNSSKFMETYSNKFILRGVKVKYEQDGKKRSCRVKGVNEKTCALEIELKGVGTQRVTSPSLITVPKKIKLKKEV